MQDAIGINIGVTQTGDKALVQVKNDAIIYWVDKTSPDTVVTVTMPRKTLEGIAQDPSTTQANVKTTGDATVFDRFVNMLDVFNPGFNIVTPKLFFQMMVANQSYHCSLHKHNLLRLSSPFLN
jgi:alkyl sulfatase BDS1-like metallo-beta-lactamase superfamily hydrolase